MLRRYGSALFMTGLAIGLLLCDDVLAQRARRPTIGQALEEQESVGTLEGNERFMRDNRDVDTFVGRDIEDMERFIGHLQGTLDALAGSSVDGVRRRIDRSGTINQPVSPTGIMQNQIYYPRIDLNVPAGESLGVASGSVESSVLDTLARSSRMPGSSRLSVSVEGRTATLRGEVPSADARGLAEVLLSFEPGVSSIRNELEVNPDLEPGPGSLQARRNRLESRESWVTLGGEPEERGASEGSAEDSAWETVASEMSE